MSKSRRHFLTQTSLGLLGAAVASSSSAQDHAEELAQEPTQLPPGAPPAFGTGPAVGPDVSPATFAEAEKLVQINLTTADRALAAETWRVNMASLYERRTGPRNIALEPTLAPWSRYISVLPGQPSGPQRDRRLLNLFGRAFLLRRRSQATHRVQRQGRCQMRAALLAGVA